MVVEFLSPGTEAEDLGRFYRKAAPARAKVEDGQTGKATLSGKLEVYERRLRVPHYIVCNRYDRELRYFKLEGGQYQEQPLRQATPAIWLPDLEMGLGIWQGVFEGIPGDWLRWCNQTGDWLLTDTEAERLAKQQAQQQVEQERLAKQQAKQQIGQERLAKDTSPGSTATSRSQSAGY